MPRASASKKTALASEQDRPDVARKRLRWKAHQGSVDLQRLVFIDESEPLKAPLVRAQGRTAKTNMTPLRGLGGTRQAADRQGPLRALEPRHERHWSERHAER